MANFKILLAFCFCMLASTTRVMAMKNTQLCIPDEDRVEEVYDKDLETTTTQGTITVTKEKVKTFPCVETANTLQEVLDILVAKVKTKKMKLWLPIGEDFYEYCAVTSVEFANWQSGVKYAQNYTADFKFTFTLEVDHTKWQPCIFASLYYGFREIGTKKIHITTTNEVMEYLKSLLESHTVLVEDVDANGKPVTGWPKYQIQGIENYVEKIVLAENKQCNFDYKYMYNVS